MKIEIGLMLFFMGVLLFVVYLNFYRKRLIFEFFDDDPSSLPVTVEQPTSLQDNSDYKNFFAWNQSFCEVWNKVIDNSMKFDNSTDSKEDYIAILGTKLNMAFPSCLDNIFENPDPRTIINYIPDSTIPYENALSYMGSEISKIKQNLEAALQGMPPASAESFVDTPTQPCVSCVPEPEAVTVEKQTAINTILQKLATFNPKIPGMQGQLTIVQSGLNDLEAIQKKAQDGSLIQEVNVPASFQ